MKTTTGDTHECPCPACGPTIGDLWDYGTLDSGDDVECGHCGETVTVVSVETTHVVTLGSDEPTCATCVWRSDGLCGHKGGERACDPVDERDLACDVYAPDDPEDAE